MMQSSPRNFPNGLVLPWPPLPEVYNQIGGIYIFNIITMKMENNWDFLSSSCCWDSNLCSPGKIRSKFFLILIIYLVYPEGSCDQVWSICRVNSWDEPPGFGSVLPDGGGDGVGEGGDGDGGDGVGGDGVLPLLPPPPKIMSLITCWAIGWFGPVPWPSPTAISI